MRKSKFQFINPYLEEMYFSAVSNFDVENSDIEIQNSFSVEIKKNEDKNRANVKLILESNTRNENAPFKLCIKVASDFKWEDIDTSKVDSMLKINAPALLLGYMRPIVANITNSAGLPAYNLPFVNFKE